VASLLISIKSRISHSCSLFTILTLYFIFGNNFIIANQQDSAYFAKNPLYIQETGLYEIYKTKKADIVMLGDSNVRGADWNELLGREKVVGRGITSDVIEGYLSRLNYVIKLKPKVCFIIGGLNDVYSWIPLENIIQNYTRLIQELKSKGIIVVVQSAIYTTKEWPNSENRNPEVQKLNSLLKEYCSNEKIHYIDLNSNMSTGLYINSNLVNSWGHLNAKGYKIWANEVDKVLKKLGF